MNQLLRSIRRKRNRKSAKYKFAVVFKELTIEGKNGFKPEKIVVGCMHGSRRYLSKERKTEPSFAEHSRSLVIWPDAAADAIEFVTTLFKDREEQFDDKDWTLVVEEISSKGRYKPLAAISLNLRLFASNNERKVETKLKLRPLRPEVKLCTLQLHLSSTQILETTTSFPTTPNVSIGRRASVEVEPIKVLPEHIDSSPIGTSSSITKPPDYMSEQIKFRQKHESKESTRVSVSSVKSKGEDKKILVHQRSSKEDIVSMPPMPENTAKSPTESKTSLARQLSKPQCIPGEGLLEWCQRIAKDYDRVKITDFTKSFKSGLAFCALIHRYAPHLIGDFANLDSESSQGQKDNCRKAFDAAFILGVERTLDESETIILPNRDAIISYLERLRIKLEGSGVDNDQTDNICRDISDHRISGLFALSETEQNVMRELQRLKLGREQSEDMVGTYQQKAVTQQSNTKTDSVHSDVTPKSFHRDENRNESKANKSANKPPPSTTQFSPTSQNDKKRWERHQEEARRLLREALTDSSSSSATKSSINGAMSQSCMHSFENGTDAKDAADVSLKRSTSIRSITSLGSQSDLRTLDETPLLPAFAKPSERLTNGSTQSQALISTAANAYSAFDRVKRYGSMRGQELADSIAQYVSPRVVMEVNQKLYVDQPSSDSQNATPTRKLMTSFEKDLRNLENIATEIEKITQRISELEGLSAYVEQKMRDLVPGSEEEEKLVSEHLKLVAEKNSLVRRQDYLNDLIDLTETTEQIAQIQTRLVRAASLDESEKDEDEKKNIDELMDTLKKLVDKKNDLTHMLMDNEAEEEEELNRLRTQQTNFLRGEPVSTSKRLLTWLKS